MTFTVTASASGLSMTTPAHFGAAVQASAELQVPEADRSDVTVTVQITDKAKVYIALGPLSLSSGVDATALVMGAQAAACLGIDGTCFVLLADSRRYRQLSASTATLDVTRTYVHSTSPNASVPVSTQIDAGLLGLGADATGMQQTALSSTVTVVAAGTASASAVDDAFASRTVLDQQLAMRLPGIDVAVSVPRLMEPPSPPPPPPAAPPPAVPPLNGTDANGTASGGGAAAAAALLLGDPTVYVFGIVTGLSIVLCFLVGYAAARHHASRRYRVADAQQHKLTGGGGKEAAAEGARARIAADDGDGDAGAGDATWRPPTPRSAAAAAAAPTAESEASAAVAEPERLDRPKLLSSLFGGDEGGGVVADQRASGRTLLAPLGGKVAPEPLPPLPSTLAHSVSTSAVLPAATPPKPAIRASKSMAHLASDTAEKPHASKAPPDRKAPSKPPPPAPPSKKAPPLPPGKIAPEAPVEAAPPTPPSPDAPLSHPSRKAPTLKAAIRTVQTLQGLQDGSPLRQSRSTAWGEAPAGSATGTGTDGAGNPPENPSSSSSWQRVRIAHANHSFAKAKTMFDDGRFLRSVVLEARAAGLQPARGRGGSDAARRDDAPPLLRKFTSQAMSKEPQQTPLPEGADGGGGVRIFPPNLHESLGSYAECFQTMPRTQSMAEAELGAESSWTRKMAS